MLVESYESWWNTDEFVEKEFDYMFVIPAMSAPKFITQAGISSQKGNWVDVDKFSLQHKSYKNIFAVGDCASVPNLKERGIK